MLLEDFFLRLFLTTVFGVDAEAEVEVVGTFGTAAFVDDTSVAIEVSGDSTVVSPPLKT